MPFGRQPLTSSLAVRRCRPHDRADLRVFLSEADPSWLPDTIPVRETRALVLALLMPRFPSLVDELVETATDALRLLYALMGADPGLRTPPVRRQSLAREIRRTVLARLDRLPVEQLVEDMLRHHRAWKRVGENLHPFEFADRYPVAALAFAVLRGTTLDATSPAGRAVLSEAARHPVVLLEGGRLRMNTFASRVEGAFATGRPDLALNLLRTRPGEMLRRLVQLAHALPVDSHGSLVEAVTTAVSDVSPFVLTAALGQVRTPPGDLRLFFPAVERPGSGPLWMIANRFPRSSPPRWPRYWWVSCCGGQLLCRGCGGRSWTRSWPGWPHLVRGGAPRRRCCG